MTPTLTIEEAAAKLCVCKRSVRDWLAAGVLQEVSTSKRGRVKVSTYSVLRMLGVPAEEAARVVAQGLEPDPRPAAPAFAYPPASSTRPVVPRPARPSSGPDREAAAIRSQLRRLVERERRREGAFGRRPSAE